MTSTPEGKVKRKIKRFLDSQGVYHFSPIGGPYSTQGVPDIICCVPGGHFLGIEVKAPGMSHTVSVLQAHNIKRINAVGGRAIVADSLDTVVVLFKLMGWLKNAKPETDAEVARQANAGRRMRFRSAGVSRDRKRHHHTVVIDEYDESAVPEVQRNKPRI